MRINNDGGMIGSGSISGSESPHGSPHSVSHTTVQVGSGGMNRVDSATRMAAESYHIIRATHPTSNDHTQQQHHPLIWMRPNGALPSLITAGVSSATPNASSSPSSSSSIDSPISRQHQYHNISSGIGGRVTISSPRSHPSMEASTMTMMHHQPSFNLTVHDSHFSMPSAMVPTARSNNVTTSHPNSNNVGAPHQASTSTNTSGPSFVSMIPNPVGVVTSLLQGVPHLHSRVSATPTTVNGGSGPIPPTSSPFVRLTATGAQHLPASTARTATTTGASLGDDDDDWALIDEEHLYHPSRHIAAAAATHRPLQPTNTPTPNNNIPFARRVN
jgi:hypothetical protein